MFLIEHWMYRNISDVGHQLGIHYRYTLYVTAPVYIHIELKMGIVEEYYIIHIELIMDIVTLIQGDYHVFNHCCLEARCLVA